MTEESYEIDKLNDKDPDGGETAPAPVTKGQEEPRGVRRARLARQVGLVMLVSLAYVALGSTLTWPSPAVSSLARDNSTLVNTNIVLTDAEKDMTGSLVYLGSLFGAWVAGGLVAKLGRRLSLQILVGPYLCGWLVTALAPSTACLLVGRFILGVAGGATTIAGYAYVVELPDVTIRGMMATMPTLGVVLGSLYTVALGYLVPWHYLSLLGAVPALVFFLATFALPESPSYLVVRGRRQRALAILRVLRGNYVDVEAEVAELERLNSSGGGGWRGLLERSVLRRILLVVLLFVFMQFCGNFVFMIYTARILKAAGAAMDPDAVAAIAGTLRVAGTLAAIFLVDVLGRRYCLVISHAINAGCLAILATFVYMAEHAPADQANTYQQLSWVPTVCVTLALFFCDIGVHPIPFMVSSEYFPTKIRAQASSVCISAGTTVTFAALQLFSPMMQGLTQAGLYWFYSATSVVAVFFCFFAIIETKGKTVG